VSEELLNLNQGTPYPALVRLEQYGWIAGEWGRTENNREAKFYAITKAGVKALGEETARRRQMIGLVERLLNEDGSCVAAFRLVDALFLRPLPIAHAELLYVLSRQVIDQTGAPHDSDFWAYPDFVRMRDVSKKDADLIAVSFTERYDQ